MGHRCGAVAGEFLRIAPLPRGHLVAVCGDADVTAEMTEGSRVDWVAARAFPALDRAAS